MDWIFDNINVIVVIGGAIAYWLNARARQKAGEDADYDGDGIPEVRGQPREQTTPMAQESEAEDRARRIREEIRRKIQERMNGGAPADQPSPYTAPRPVAAPMEMPRPFSPPPLPSPEATPPPRPTPKPASNDEDTAARQRHLAERLAQLREDREQAERQAEALRKKAAATLAAAQPARSLPAITSLAGELRDPATLRRAIIWQEILGRPVSQR